MTNLGLEEWFEISVDDIFLLSYTAVALELKKQACAS